jgi:WD40 repeat protein
MSLEGHQLGRYRLQHLLGSGGMGEVYLATDASLNRQVAIKVIRAEAASYSETQAAKEAARLFQRELRAIAALDHPHILPLFDSGEESAGRTTLIYMVMPYRQEGSLADWLHQRGSDLLSPQDIVYLVEQAASALQHAHSQQIIHQDVKPSNFLIRSREKRPDRPDLLLADFGVAKFISATAEMSQASRGTPTYMAPEQWEGCPVPATDQYALAVMAYELLTRRPPFQGGMAQLMYQHFHVQPQPPSTSHPRLPQALDVVLLRALAKDPEERFSSVSAFAGAFEQAVQSSEAPTVAKPPPAPSRDLHATLAISPQEALTGTSRSLTLPGGRRVTVTIPAGVQDGQVIRVEGQGEAAEGGVAGTLVLTLAIAASEAMAPRSDALQAEAQTFLSDTPPVPPTGVTPPSQVLEQARSSSPSSESLQPTVLAGPSGQPTVQTEAAGPSIAQEPQASRRGQHISRREVLVGLAALAVAGGGLTWWIVSRNPPEGTLFSTYTGHTNAVFAVAWSPDGSRIASGSGDNTVQVWNAADGSQAYTFREHTGTVYAVAWSPDGNRIASGSADGIVQVWNAANGSPIYTYTGHTSTVYTVAWSPDGNRIASGSSDNTVQVWNAADSSPIYTYTGHTNAVFAVAWSPDGNRIASGSSDNTVRVWDATDGSQAYAYTGHTNSVSAVAWSSDGNRIASGSADNIVQVWNAADGSPIYTYTGHTNIVFAVAWSSDGSRIASGSADGTVQVWNAADGSHAFTYRGQSNVVKAVAWSPDGKRIVSGTTDGTVQVWQGG